MAQSSKLTDGPRLRGRPSSLVCLGPLALNARPLLGRYAWQSLHLRDRRRVPLAGERFGLRGVSRMVKLNGPFGAGSQLASLSAPGLSFWK